MTLKCRHILAVVSLLLLSSSIASAQTKEGAPAQSFEDIKLMITVKEKIESFTDDLEALQGAIQSAPADVYPDLLKRYNSAKLRWNTYYQSYQGFIADNEELMQSVSDYGVIDEAIQAEMEELKAKLDAKNSFDNAMKFIGSQDSVYVGLYKKANALSATPKLEGELAKLKGREQLTFAEIQKKYDEACAAMELMPSLKEPMEHLEEKYIALKCLSEKIQEAAYKPFIQRIKDYLLGMATVAVLLMFLSMVQSKWKAAKQMKENAKKMAENFGGSKDDYPSI